LIEAVAAFVVPSDIIIRLIPELLIVENPVPEEPDVPLDPEFPEVPLTPDVPDKPDEPD